MILAIDQASCPFRLSADFLAILATELTKLSLPDRSGVILNFRDPDYSAETDGFHPVEISITTTGRIEYITDFAYVGMGPFAELAKEIDFDFSLGLFQHFGREFPLTQGRELFVIWQTNFVSYYRMGVYSVTAEES